MTSKDGANPKGLGAGAPPVHPPDGRKAERKRTRSYVKTGVFGLKRRLKERGIKALDGRTTAARAIN